jgi:hypothetical protein
MDEDDYIYFKSRSKELVIRGGVNVYPVSFSINVSSVLTKKVNFL